MAGRTKTNATMSNERNLVIGHGLSILTNRSLCHEIDVVSSVSRRSAKIQPQMQLSIMP